MNEKSPRTFDSSTPMEVLLEKAGDFDLVNGTFVKIGDRYRHWVDACRYQAEERIIMLVWHSAGIVDNGGFEYLFEGDYGDPDFRITADAYQAVGLTRGYQAFQEAFGLFPGGKIPHDAHTRLAQYLKAPEALRMAINEKHWNDRSDKSREKLLARFIRANRAKLGKLD
jgi:hypothetical protein